jgi:hypothetical protein
MPISWPPEKAGNKAGSLMKVRMLVDREAALDGTHVTTFEAGKAYDVPVKLGEAWLTKGIAMQDKMLPGPSETKEEIEPPKKKARRK